MKACRGDHRRIVGAHLARGQEDPKALAPRSVGHRGAKRTVRGYATGEADRLRPALEGGTNRLCDEDIDDAGLKGRRDIGRSDIWVLTHVSDRSLFSPEKENSRPSAIIGRVK